jgi:hypothetical protein
MEITDCIFGHITIDGKRYSSDLIIYPDGRIMDSWWRKKSHVLSIDDIGDLIRSGPDVIIAGTGISGMMKPEDGLRELLVQKGIRFMPAPNGEAMHLFNNASRKLRAGACFHLTC